MSREPISFKCDACCETSGGFLDFRYDAKKHWRSGWVIEEEWEYTSGIANCLHCGELNEVWPKISVDRKWVKRQ